MKYVFSLILLTTLALAACDEEKLTSTGVDTLNEAISRIEKNSNSWQETLKETRDKLISEGQSTLANEVSDTLSRATSNVGIEAKCTTDFLRQRAKEDLIRLRATLTGEALQLNPAFCQPTPNIVDLNLEPRRREKIEFAGYNLVSGSVKAFLETSAAQKIDVSNSLDHPSDYLMTMILAKVPNLSNGERLIFEFDNGKYQSIGITQKRKRQVTEFQSGLIRITGTIKLNDDETFGSDENRSVAINTSITVPSGAAGKTYDWNACVGDEVHGYLNVRMELDRQTGDISSDLTSEYFEGTKCGRTDRHGYHATNFDLKEGENYKYNRDLADRDGAVSFNLAFKYDSAKKITKTVD